MARNAEKIAKVYGNIMDLIRINEVVDGFGISSRTLRYYEQMGLIWSSRPDNKQQRYYDAAALERLKQIVILRKLQIPVKDIVQIFKSESTTALIQAFVDKLDTLDTEISALSELRKLVDDFLQKMLNSGIRKISAITLLYEETEKRLDKDTMSASKQQHEEPVTLEKLSEISRETLKLHDVRIIRLPSTRILTSRAKTGQIIWLDEDKMINLFTEYGFTPEPGFRNCFFRKISNEEWLMEIVIPSDFDNQTPYTDATSPGGLYAIASSFMEDMDETFGLLRDWIKKSGIYLLDTERNEMIEEILPWDIAKKLNRYQQDIFIPIRMRSEENE